MYDDAYFLIQLIYFVVGDWIIRVLDYNTHRLNDSLNPKNKRLRLSLHIR